MQQHLILGIGDFGASVIERVQALPIEKNLVYHRLQLTADSPVAASYLAVRQRLLEVLNKEVYNFANTQLTVYLVGLLVEQHMAENLMHLGYLFKTFFRENIILNPRVKLVTAFPTIVPEEAYAWLPATRRTLERLDALAALKEQFQPEYAGVKRALPAISGPPFEDVIFCYSESLDEEDVALTAQAAATKIYFDLVVLPERMAADSNLAQFYRSFPAGQGFLPLSGCAVAFLPSLAKLVRDEMEYVLLMRLMERFFPVQPPDSAKLDKLLEDVLRKGRAARTSDIVEDIVTQALEQERWFDVAAIDALPKYDIEMSPPPDAYLISFLANLERERNRFAGRVRDLALELVVHLPERLLTAIRTGHPGLDLWEVDTLLTRASVQVFQIADQSRALARQAKAAWERARQEASAKAGQLREIAGAKDAKLKHGTETEARIEELLRSIDSRELLRQAIAVSVAEALADDTTLEARLREAYDRLHEVFAAFLKRRTELMAHLTNRRDAFLKRRELHLYVFNQVFRQRLLDAEIQKRLAELQQAPADDKLSGILSAYFFKQWLPKPELALEEVEASLLEIIRSDARKEIEQAALDLELDYRDVVRILHEIARDQSAAIFDMKYKEHPQTAYRQALFLYHQEEKLSAALAAPKLEGVDLTDIGLVKGLPFQVLQISELYNLPFRALRQYASMDRTA